MKLFTVTLVFLSIMVIGLPLNGFGQCPGITEDTIKIGIIQPLSGVAANYGQAGLAVDKALWRDINEKGGIGGRKVKLVIEDSHYEPRKGVSAYLKLAHQDKVFGIIGVLGAAIGGAFHTMSERDKVPVYHQSPGRILWDPPKKYYFSFLSSYEVQFGNLLGWYADKIGKKKKARVGVIYQDDAYGKGGFQGYKIAAKKAGYEIVASASFGRMDTDLSAQVLQMRNANVDLLGIVANTKAAAFIINEANKMRMNVPMFGHADENVLPLVNKPYGELYGAMFSVLWHERDKVPGLKRVKVLFDKYNVNIKGMPGFQFAWRASLVRTAAEAFNRMFASGDISREGFVKATESIRDWNCEGMSVITFGPNRRLSSDAICIYRASEATGMWERKANWVRYMDWKE